MIQVYSSKPNSDIDRPIKELRAFKKTSLLNPGESTRLKMQIPQSELSYWSEDESQWVLENGIYSFNVGNSSRTLPLNIDVNIK